MAINRRKLLRFVRFIRRFTLHSASIVLAISFLLASGVSLMVSYLALPVGPSQPDLEQTNNIFLKVGTRQVNKGDQEIILTRNIFNSEGKTGDGSSNPTKAGQARTADRVVKSDLPFRLAGVIFSGDPYNGLAMIDNTQKKQVRSYVVGDVVQDDVKIVEIYDDRVIFERGGGREYIELEKFVLTPPKRKGQSNSGPTNPGLVIDRLAVTPPPESHKEDGFERKGMNIKLTEEFKRNLLAPEMLAKVLQDAKAEPNMVGGELKGFRLTRIRENSAYEKAGFQNNDVIEEINGIPLRDAGGAIRLLNQLRTTKEIEVRVNRGGTSSNMLIQIQ